MRFDLVDLRLFLNVFEAGSITAGAQRSNMALASASERIQAMELTLASPLLERLHRGVRPTPAGKALAHHALTILDQLDRMRGDLAAYGAGLRGHIRMMANTSALSEHLPEPLATFLAANPDVDLDIEEALSFEIVRAVAAGRVEIGVLSANDDVGALETRSFRRDDLVLVTAPEHPLAARETVAFAETLDEDHIGLGTNSAWQNYLSGHARRLGRTIKLRARMRGFDAICRLAEHGVGVGIVPGAAARRARRSMEIKLTPLSDGWAVRRLAVATRRDAELSPHARALIAHLVEDEPPT